MRAAVRSKEDPEDVVQSAYRSFFRRQRGGQFQIDSWDDVWGILTVITVRKCGRHWVIFALLAATWRAEVRLLDAAGPDAGWEAIAREPTPAEAAALAETVQELLSGLDKEGRAILELHLQGCTTAEISAQVGYSTRTVRRTLDRIRHHLRCPAGSEEEDD